MIFTRKTEYIITFNEEASDHLKNLARVLERILPEDCCVEVLPDTGSCELGGSD